MRIVSWNCNGALRNKTDRLDQLDADILIVQECEDPQFHSGKYREWAGDYLWVGANKHKGIGVFAKKTHKLEKLNWSGTFHVQGFEKDHQAHHWSTSQLQHFLPFRIDGALNVLGVWTKSAPVYSYIGQLWQYIQIHRKEIGAAPILIVGDLNSNKIWDVEGRWWNHSDVVEELSDLGIVSFYHHFYKEEQGKETRPTFYMQRNSSKPYHIDYAFGTCDLLSGASLEIGLHEEWNSNSDHMPLILDI